MSDTPIAERLAAELGMPWPLRPPRHRHLEGWIFEDFGVGAPLPEIRIGGPEGCGPDEEQGRTRLREGVNVANPNCGTCRGSGTKSKMEKGTKENGEEYEWWRQVPCGC